MTRKKVHTLIALGNLCSKVVQLHQVRKAQAEAAELRARRAIIAADEQMLALKREQLALRNQQIAAQTHGINARTTRSVIGQDIDRNRKEKQYAELELMELKIKILRRELGLVDTENEFNPMGYDYP